MKVKYFTETDTLYIEFVDGPIAESRDLDENTVLDVDAEGRLCAITIEHARDRTEIPPSFEQVKRTSSRPSSRLRSFMCPALTAVGPSPKRFHGRVA